MFTAACAWGADAKPKTAPPTAGMPGDAKVPVDPKLPNVLIIGDSISIGFTRNVRALLVGKANVYRPCLADGTRSDNCGDTAKGLQCLDAWLAGRDWDVIHFNWGMHDVKYVPVKDEKGKIPDPKNRKQVRTPEEYAQNLEQLVAKLKARGKKLIFATTTLVPPGEPARIPGDELKYNQAAVEVMQKHGIKVNDLHALTAQFPANYFYAPANVHYSSEGYQKLADQVAKYIAEDLQK